MLFSCKRPGTLGQSSWFRSVGLGLWASVLSFGLIHGVALEQAQAQTAQAEIPETLRPWIPWVLAERGETACVQMDGAFACVWPGLLELDLTQQGGTFSQHVFAEARALHVLPGGPENWPLEVTEGGKKLAVIQKDGVPQVELSPGSHKLEGSFSWHRLPETLAIGAYSAFVELRIQGHEVPLVKRDGGQLWLESAEPGGASGGEAEHVELDVFRKVSDSIPLVVETRLVFQVAGKARELELPDPLLQGTAPLAVSGDLAVALSASGALRVQLTPGRHEITLRARSLGMPSELRQTARLAPWPSQEVWVFEPAPTLRVVELEGAPGIDASRTVLPDAWKQLSAYAVSPETVLTLRTTRRGQPQLPPNKLTLNREFWLDDSADTFTVRDQLSGEMHQGWRLDLVHGELGEAQTGNEAQVITESPGSKRRGLELRDASLSLRAVSRVPNSANLAAVGWSTNVDSLSANLHLPPGWDVFAASGVDAVRDTWVDRWNLFSVFYVLVLSLATSKLVSRGAGVVAFVALVLSHDRDGAPEYIWLVLIVLSALSAVIHAERARRALRWAFLATTLVLAALLLTFAVDEVRYAIYPHLHDDFGSYAADLPAGLLEAKEEAPPAPAAPAAAQEDAKMGHAENDALQLGSGGGKKLDTSNMEGGTGTRSRDSFSSNSAPKRSDNYGSAPAQKQFQPGAVVQTGPGVPDTNFSTWELSWSGPVTQDHTMRFYLISPWTGRVMTALRLAALGLFAYLLWRALPRPATPAGSGAPAGAALGLALLMTAGLLLTPESARADEPSTERLAELSARVNRAALCEPDCVSVAEASILLGDGLEFRASVHAGATVAYKLPGPAAALGAVHLQVDGKAATNVRLAPDGAYYVRLEAGVHEIELRASLPSDQTTLDIGSRPHFVRVKATGWVVSGISDDGQVAGSTLTLVRAMPRTAEEGDKGKTPQAGGGQVNVPPWFRVKRQVSLGVNGRTTTLIERVSDPNSPEMLSVPLLEGEQVTTPEIEVRGNVALVSFPRGVTSREFFSTLGLSRSAARSFELTLTSPAGASYSETWTLECGVVWHCTTSGLATTSHLDSGRYLETFSPWPGETLKLRASEPAAAAGGSLTIERVLLTVTPGLRMGESQLELGIRTSRSQLHTVTLPQAAQLARVEVDGVEQSAKNEHGAVRLALTAGSHRVSIRYQEEIGLRALFTTSPIDLGAPATNARVVLEIPQERWLLLTGGPGYGPAVLFWGYLLLILVVANLLPLVPYNPLSRWQWILLGIGLAQMPAPLAVFVVGWFFLVATRPSWQNKTGYGKDLLQVALIASTVAFLSVLTAAVYQGLVISPDMEVTGAGSYSGSLAWYMDRTPRELPSRWFLSVSIWVWRGVMLAWALWLAKTLLGWLRWSWGIAHQGGFWAPSRRAPKPPRTEPESTTLEPIAPEGGAPAESDTDDTPA